ncbi:sensor histidine kinase [Sphaerisporangium sp. TRM90804]|uniref:sensor histidine kinase n=1 Tax=Sphaerisporangium sp. TRM90804 TaxID=3031113 RepID=UPI00244966B7|nr:sensor histidine kinase [Sphaerisporangium sp. TRM90804]MDH2428401.1 sensor histidine kinase [Sphaerisporangium sp. TRM90804]
MTPDDARHVADGQLASGMAALPYLVLAVSAGLTLLIEDTTPAGRLAILGLTALAAGWTLWMVTLHPAWMANPKAAGLYVAGLVGFIAALGLLSPWFAGFYAFTGYVHSWALLRGRWRVVGVAGTAAAAVTGYFGGLPGPDPAVISSYLLFIVAITVLVVLVSLFGDITADQGARSRKMVEQLAEANARLEETMRENSGLQAQLLLQAREAGVTDERQRMAREIHDTLAQGLAGIITQVQAAAKAKHDPAEWQRHLDNAARLARDSLAEARRSVHAVGPGELESARLPEALAEVTKRWEGIHGVRVEFATTGDARPLHPEVEVTLLRVAQEALANVGKHAGAARVGVTVSYMDDVVTLDVRDDGAGFVPGADSGGFGMTSMRQRVTRLAGTFEVESEPGGGAAVSATIPVGTAVSATIPAGEAK